ncbi:hypothetical protein PIIN_03298 [Serendipita indica DSM 11827]|uniref:Uncharacterized protein n=1 Tax=Serendipita indica (strain DSM 11827) TaxID=1109443 RepID=G4TDK0_SERID|nr:hypothetical protein PIIN_03298 [Serendipita indica DSM 11827]
MVTIQGFVRLLATFVTKASVGTIWQGIVGNLHQSGQPAIADESSFNEGNQTNQHVVFASWINRNGQSIPVQFALNTNFEVVISDNVGAYAAVFYDYHEKAAAARLFCANNDHP